MRISKNKIFNLLLVLTFFFSLSINLVYAWESEDKIQVHKVNIPKPAAKPAASNKELFSDKLTQVKGLRFGSNKDGIRIVMDLSKKTTFQVRSIKDSSLIYVDIFNADIAKGFKVPRLKPDPLLSVVKVEQYNPRQVRMTLRLRYGIPIENVDVIELKNPNRIAIDLFREYSNFIQFYITRNIVWLQTEKAAGGRFTLINELYINHKSPDVTVDVELAKNLGKKREVVSNIVKKRNAIAGVNGGYFGKGGQNLGLIVKEGKVIAPSVKRRPPRTAFGITFDNNIVFNRVVDKQGKLITKWGRTWKSIVTALGAGPRVISNGKVHITAKQEGLGKGGNDITRRTGRSALGVTKDGNLALFTFSGFRSNHKDGVKLPDMANYLLSRQIKDAMNLDGGGSTAMSIMGYLVSKPPQQGKYQRPVANALLIYDSSPIISPCYMGIEPPQIVMPADGVSETRLRILICDKNEKPVPDKTPVAFASGVGLFKQKYYYTKNGLIDINVKSARAPGNYSIKVECGPLRTFIPMKLTSGDPANLLVSANVLKTCPVKTKSKKAAPKKKYFKDSGKSGGSVEKTIIAGKGSRFILKALVRDEYGNPLKGAGVKFTVVEGKGKFSASDVITKANGVGDTSFTLQSKKAKIMISAKNLKPVYKDFGEQ